MPRRILVVANETCPSRELHRAVQRLAGEDDVEALVVAPALNGWLATWAGDEDDAVRRARMRLGDAVAGLYVLGLDVQGVIGDANPIVAIEDALRWFPADAIVISTHPPRRSRWLRRHVTERAARFGRPVMHVIVDGDRAAAPAAA